MPFKDRQKNLDAARHHHDIHRPSPQPLSQTNGALPPYGGLIYDDDGERVQCHACGRFFRALNVFHLRMHGHTVESYKAEYGLARGTSLWSPQYQEQQRQLALARDQGAVGREAIKEIGPNPRQKGIKNRLGSRINASVSHKGKYRGKMLGGDEPPSR